MKRYLQLDFFRGIFLIIITIDHFLSPHNVIRKFTDGFIGWVSAAEGFVFLSGLTAGLVYTYKFHKKGIDNITKAAKTRAWHIYKYHILLFLFLFVVLSLVNFMADYWYKDYSVIVDSPATALSLASILLYQPIYMDILPMYAIYILFVPFIISNFNKGNFLKILAISGALYLVGQVFNIEQPTKANESYSGIDFSYFDLFSWQVLFVTGLLFGYLLYSGKTEKIGNLKPVFIVSVVIALSLFVLRRFESYEGMMDLSSYTNKGNLAPLRLLNFASLTFLISYIAIKKKSWFRYDPVCTLGKHSLEVFSFHIVLMILLRPIKDVLRDGYNFHLNSNTFFNPVSLTMLLIILAVLFVIPAILRKQKIKISTGGYLTR